MPQQKLTITLEDSGMLSLEGPENLQAAYGLLELAKDALRMRAAQQQKIQPVMGRELEFLKRG
jgi:hypothetical protein